jgi:hypothetical protein
MDCKNNPVNEISGADQTLGLQSLREFGIVDKGL